MKRGRPPNRNFIQNLQGRGAINDFRETDMEATSSYVNEPVPSTSRSMIPSVPRPIRASKIRSRESISDLMEQLNENEVIDHLEHERQRQSVRRLEETPFERGNRIDQVREYQRQHTGTPQTYKVAMSAEVEYSRIGPFNVACVHCGAIYFPEERVKNRIGRDSFGDCCLHGKYEYKPSRFPNELALLFTHQHRLSKLFSAGIRRLNAIFAFASFNVKDDRTSNTKGIYCFTAGGQVYHRINIAAQPTQDSQGEYERPRNGQMFFLDPTDAIDERIAANTDISLELIQLLEGILRDNNPFAQAFMMMREVIEEENARATAQGIQPPQVNLVLAPPAGLDPNRYNIATSNEVSAIITLKADQTYPDFDRVVKERGKQLLTMRNTDNRIEPFTYPLFFPQGDLGFSPNIAPTTAFNHRTKISRLEFVMSRLAFRLEFVRPLYLNVPTENTTINFNALHFGGRLLQQYVVDMFVSVERDRINSILLDQKKLKAQLYKGVDTMLKQLAEEKGATVGQKVILPSTFVGSTRWYSENFEDAMAIVRRFGRPDLFVTVTTNPEWPEITEALCIELGDGKLLRQNAQDRPDIVARVAKRKFDQIVEDIHKKQIFGKSAAYVYAIEFQKRGLPHMHLLVIMTNEDKIKRAEDIDNFISAEIPDDDPELRALVLKWMIHQPCGEHNPNSSCMRTKNGRNKCRFNFPQEFHERTSIVDDEKPKYRRRYVDNLDPNNTEFTHGQAVYRKDCHGQRITRDNRHIAPYNGYLLKKYNCHINVEYVGSIQAVKYLYKYIYKGHDCARLKITENGQQIMYNEAETYVDARYISPPEACWRLFCFELQRKSHSVQRLAIHLEGLYQRTEGQEEEDMADIGQKGSTLEAYFRLNAELKQREDTGEQVNYQLYCNVPEKYTWKANTSGWTVRRGNFNKIGRVHTVSLISHPELYYLRTLLFHVNNATSFDDLYVVDGIRYSSYKQACLARGLTYDDQQWIEGLRESALSKMPRIMRSLFVQILIFGSPENPKNLWEMFKQDLAGDFIHQARQTGQTTDCAIQRAYRLIANKLNTEATEGRNFQYWVQLGMDDINSYEDISEQEMLTTDECVAEGDQMYRKLNVKQRDFVDTVLRTFDDPSPIPKCFYLDGPGGTGKSFVYATLYHLIRGRQRTARCMGFTGISAINLPEGRTAHKTFGLRVPLTSESTSSIKPGSLKAKALKETDAFLMDEATMLPRYGMENMNDLLQAIHKNRLPFGGVLMIFGGDFRQCLPVQPRANKIELIDLCIKQSPLWKHFQQFALTKNMRLEAGEEEFAEYLIALGDGKLPTNDKNEIEVAEDICFKGDIVNEAFGAQIASGEFEDLKDRAILAPLNAEIGKINNDIIQLLPGIEKVYKSFDSIKDQADATLQFTPEFLNSIDIADLPPHELRLKKNTIIMLLRNLDVTEGMCNGTRLIVTELCNHIIKAKIITGEHSGRFVHIPRITLDSSKSHLGNTMQRHQFPIRQAFAMTIHKSQGQTLKFVGVILLTAVFMHGMLYVAFSRVKNRNGLKVVLPSSNSTHTRNEVWKEILNNRSTVPPMPMYNPIDMEVDM